MKPSIKKHIIKDKILERLKPNELGRIHETHSFSLAKDLEVERYVISTLLDHMELDGYVKNVETSSKLDGGLGGKIAKITPAGLYFFDEGGYTTITKIKFRHKLWIITKIVAAVLNALMILGIAVWGVKAQIDANSTQVKADQSMLKQR